MNLSEKIIKIREENNLTQYEMAEKIFVTRQAISKWEEVSAILPWMSFA